MGEVYVFEVGGTRFLGEGEAGQEEVRGRKCCVGGFTSLFQCYDGSIILLVLIYCLFDLFVFFV